MNNNRNGRYARRVLRLATITMSSFVALLLTGGSATAAPCPPSAFVRRTPLVIAHASSTYFGPPNTLFTMRASLNAGADALDADVRVTSDGVLVASHDDALEATTNGLGSIATTSLADIQKFDASWTWKDPKGTYSLRGRGITIPTIEEILTAFPKRRMSLEFKAVGGEKTLCSLLRRLHRTKDVWVGSAGDAAVDRFKPICPEVVTTVTDAMVPLLRKAQQSGEAWCAPVPIGQPPFGDGTRFVTNESVRWNHTHGLAVFTWTVDDPADLATLFRVGVDGVYTGRPDLARAIFDKAARARKAKT